MKINCDIGERGAAHPIDTALMEHIDIANIACGGHAGDKESVAAFRTLAEQYSVDIAAHLSYPDRENFGRQTMDIPVVELLRSLDDQYSLMPDVKMVKFHGALYNDCARDAILAHPLATWLKKNSISRIITQFDSELALACEKEGITVLAEAFAERRYALDQLSNRLSLVSRNKDYASIHSLDDAVVHSVKIFTTQTVDAYSEAEGKVSRQEAPLKARTICIHSDSEISLDLALALKTALGQKKEGVSKSNV